MWWDFSSLLIITESDGERIFENRSTFAEVTHKKRVSCFFLLMGR